MVLTELLFEMPMKSSEELTQEGLALCILKKSGYVSIVLYEPSSFSSAFLESTYDHSCIRGYIVARDDTQECGAWMIAKVIANKNYGPTMYDMLMDITKEPLMSDRGKVSEKAQSVWDRMLGDTSKYKLKRLNTQNYECSSYLKGHQFAVSLKSYDTGYQRFVVKHKELIRNLKSQTRDIYTPNRVEELLLELAEIYWNTEG